MRVTDESKVILSPSDLTTAAACEFALLRDLDGRLGRAEPVDEPADAMLERVAELGNVHEQRVLDAYIARFGRADPLGAAAALPAGITAAVTPGSSDLTTGRGVLVLDRPDRSPEALAAAVEATLAALRSGLDVVAQGAVGDAAFAGFADFLVKEPDGAGGHVYVVEDTKLARRAKVPALLQIAAYADLLAIRGVPVAPVARLTLGSGSVAEYRVDDIVPVYRLRRARLESIIAEHLAEADAVAWGDPRYSACGVCATCTDEVERHRDLRLVAGIRGIQCAKLREAGIETIEAIAESEGPIDGMVLRTLENLRAQARLQVQADEAAAADPDGADTPYEVFDPVPIQRLPAPSPGDVFFDFEGDPMWTGDDHTEWGLEYLFGMLDPEGDFTYFWADDLAAEKRALEAFFAKVRGLRAEHPDMHVYHYAPYEVTALKRLVVTHQVGEDFLDELLRANVFVDLYSVVRRSVRVGRPSYSIKQLEPLYMGDQLRSGEVTNAADSIVEYAEYCAAVAAGDDEAAAAKRQSILDYNEYDCVSTLRLVEWLRGLVAGEPPLPSAVAQDDARGTDANDNGLDSQTQVDLAPLLQFAEPGPGGRTPQQRAAALLYAAAGFHRREDKPFWWGHFDRLKTALDEWPDSRESMVIDKAEVVQDWDMTGNQKKPRRTLQVEGVLAVGSELLDGNIGYSVYEQPVPDAARTCSPGSMGALAIVESEVIEADGEDGVARLRVVERTDQPFTGPLPVALVVGEPPRAGPLVEAIKMTATRVIDSWPDTPPSAAWDILCRTPPRTADGRGLAPVVDHAFVSAITDSVLRLDHSYLAVQGPPGTGKTYTGARVIKALVDAGWKVGVVAQSHAVVENMLRAAIRAGVDGKRVGKCARKGEKAGRESEGGWQLLPKSGKKLEEFFDRKKVRDGLLFGGTAWDFANGKRVPPELDLLVVDEAGQFSLANTIAAGVSAQRLLLLGDPQQLPQVSQGTHPEPVDESALGWLSDGRTLAPEFGYFLDQTYRMHPDLVGPVSKHSYEGKLAAHPVTAARAMVDAGGGLVAPGLRVRTVEHSGNSVESSEEAEAVVEEVRRALGWTWTDAKPGEVSPPRPMTQQDVLVVVPYNAQKSLIRRMLAEAGLGEVRVGTVDKFQGQEAPVVIVSMTVSAAADAPRGMGFVLSRNRVNVAVSRGKWLAIVVRSRGLTDYLPTNADGLLELGAFVGLGE